MAFTRQQTPSSPDTDLCEGMLQDLEELEPAIEGHADSPRETKYSASTLLVQEKKASLLSKAY